MEMGTTQRRRWPRRVLRAAGGLGAAVLLFSGLLWLYTRHNTQPVQYHPDERGKSWQVMTDERNWHHPSMMLDATAWAVRTFGVDIDDQQKVAQAGRWISAAFAAGGVTAIAFIGYIQAGLWGFVFIGVVVGCSPFLQANAHYMKEDTAMILGLGMMLLGSRLMWLRHPSRWLDALSVLYFGFSCAAVASGKYVGVVAVPIGWLMIFGFQRRFWSDLAIRPFLFLTGVAIGIVTLNYRALQEWPMVREVIAETHTQPMEAVRGGVLLPVWHAHFWWVLSEVVPWEIWVLAAVGALLQLVQWGKTNSWFWVLLALFLGTMAMLSRFCLAGFERYALPSVPMLYLLAALGAIVLIQRLARWRQMAGVGLALIVVGLGIARAFSVDRQFANDSRDRLQEWMTQNLKSGDAILAENYAGFNGGSIAGPGWEEPVAGVRLLSQVFAPDVGYDVDQLKDQFKYVIVCDMAYERFTQWKIDESADGADEVLRRREWYENLFQKGKLLWLAKPSRNLHAYTNPEIRIYRVDGKN